MFSCDAISMGRGSRFPFMVPCNFEIWVEWMMDLGLCWTLSLHRDDVGWEEHMHEHTLLGPKGIIPGGFAKTVFILTESWESLAALVSHISNKVDYVDPACVLELNLKIGAEEVESHFCKLQNEHTVGTTDSASL